MAQQAKGDSLGICFHHVRCGSMIKLWDLKDYLGIDISKQLSSSKLGGVNFNGD
jgi:hypothetical protein